MSLHRNGGRELHESLQPHWQRLYTAEMSSWNHASFQVLPLALPEVIANFFMQYLSYNIQAVTFILFACANMTHVLIVIRFLCLL